MRHSSIQNTRAWGRIPYVRYPIPGDHLPIHIQRAKQNEQKAHKLLLDNKLTIAVGHYQQQWQTTETAATTLLVYFHTTSLECWFTTTEAFRLIIVQRSHFQQVVVPISAQQAKRNEPRAHDFLTK